MKAKIDKAAREVAAKADGSKTLAEIAKRDHPELDPSEVARRAQRYAKMWTVTR